MIFWLGNTLWFSTSTTSIVDTIVMDRPHTQVLAYASSPALWPEWHPQSSKVYVNSQLPLTQGEKFEEDIQTGLGQNHLTWTVVKSSDDSWIAHAVNQNNGSHIKLQYHVQALNDKTEFTRTLDYTLPNIAFVVINSLYLKSKIETKSEDALKRLQTALKHNIPEA